MSKKYSYTADDLLEMFSDSLSPADVLSSKLMAQVSSAITKERLRLRISQQEFADHIGVPQSLVSRWEHGNYNFSIRKISEIIAELDLDADFSVSVPREKGGNHGTDNAKILVFPGQETKQEVL